MASPASSAGQKHKSGYTSSDCSKSDDSSTGSNSSSCSGSSDEEEDSVTEASVASNESDQTDETVDETVVAARAADALGRDLEAMGYRLDCESFITKPSMEESIAKIERYKLGASHDEEEEEGTKVESETRSKKSNKSKKNGSSKKSSSGGSSKKKKRKKRNRKHSDRKTEKNGKESNAESSAQKAEERMDKALLKDDIRDFDARTCKSAFTTGSKPRIIVHDLSVEVTEGLSGDDDDVEEEEEPSSNPPSDMTNTSEKLCAPINVLRTASPKANESSGDINPAVIVAAKSKSPVTSVRKEDILEELGSSKRGMEVVDRKDEKRSSRSPQSHPPSPHNESLESLKKLVAASKTLQDGSHPPPSLVRSNLTSTKSRGDVQEIKSKETKSRGTVSPRSRSKAEDGYDHFLDEALPPPPPTKIITSPMTKELQAPVVIEGMSVLLHKGAISVVPSELSNEDVFDNDEDPYPQKMMDEVPPPKTGAQQFLPGVNSMPDDGENDTYRLRLGITEQDSLLADTIVPDSLLAESHVPQTPKRGVEQKNSLLRLPFFARRKLASPKNNGQKPPLAPPQVAAPARARPQSRPSTPPPMILDNRKQPLSLQVQSGTVDATLSSKAEKSQSTNRGDPPEMKNSLRGESSERRLTVTTREAEDRAPKQPKRGNLELHTVHPSDTMNGTMNNSLFHQDSLLPESNYDENDTPLFQAQRRFSNPLPGSLPISPPALDKSQMPRWSPRSRGNKAKRKNEVPFEPSPLDVKGKKNHNSKRADKVSMELPIQIFKARKSSKNNAVEGQNLVDHLLKPRVEEKEKKRVLPFLGRRAKQYEPRVPNLPPTPNAVTQHEKSGDAAGNQRGKDPFELLNKSLPLAINQTKKKSKSFELPEKVLTNERREEGEQGKVKEKSFDLPKKITSASKEIPPGGVTDIIAQPVTAESLQLANDQKNDPPGTKDIDELIYGRSRAGESRRPPPPLETRMEFLPADGDTTAPGQIEITFKNGLLDSNLMPIPPLEPADDRRPWPASPSEAGGSRPWSPRQLMIRGQLSKEIEASTSPEVSPLRRILGRMEKDIIKDDTRKSKMAAPISRFEVSQSQLPSSPLNRIFGRKWRPVDRITDDTVTQGTAVPQNKIEVAYGTTETDEAKSPRKIPVLSLFSRNQNKLDNSKFNVTIEKGSLPGSLPSRNALMMSSTNYKSSGLSMAYPSDASTLPSMLTANDRVRMQGLQQQQRKVIEEVCNDAPPRTPAQHIAPQHVPVRQIKRAASAPIAPPKLATTLDDFMKQVFPEDDEANKKSAKKTDEYAIGQPPKSTPNGFISELLNLNLFDNVDWSKPFDWGKTQPDSLKGKSTDADADAQAPESSLTAEMKILKAELSGKGDYGADTPVSPRSARPSATQKLIAQCPPPRSGSNRNMSMLPAHASGVPNIGNYKHLSQIENPKSAQLQETRRPPAVLQRPPMPPKVTGTSSYVRREIAQIVSTTLNEANEQEPETLKKKAGLFNLWRPRSNKSTGKEMQMLEPMDIGIDSKDSLGISSHDPSSYYPVEFNDDNDFDAQGPRVQRPTLSKSLPSQREPPSIGRLHSTDRPPRQENRATLQPKGSRYPGAATNYENHPGLKVSVSEDSLGAYLQQSSSNGPSDTGPIAAASFGADEMSRQNGLPSNTNSDYLSPISRNSGNFGHGTERPSKAGLVPKRRVRSEATMESEDTWAEIANASMVVERAMDRLDTFRSEDTDDPEKLKYLLSVVSEDGMGDVEKALETLKKHAGRLGVKETDLLLAIESRDSLSAMDDESYKSLSLGEELFHVLQGMWSHADDKNGHRRKMK